MADASPLIALERIGHLSLLPALYDEVVIPKAVFAEFAPRSSTIGSELPAWLRVHEVSDLAQVERLARTLHPGEAEAITLAVELGVQLIIDEKAGRRTAQLAGLQITGTVGVLLAAKRAGLIERVDRLVAAILAAGFYVSPALIERARRTAGET